MELHMNCETNMNFGGYPIIPPQRLENLGNYQTSFPNLIAWVQIFICIFSDLQNDKFNLGRYELPLLLVIIVISKNSIKTDEKDHKWDPHLHISLPKPRCPNLNSGKSAKKLSGEPRESSFYGHQPIPSPSDCWRLAAKLTWNSRAPRPLFETLSTAGKGRRLSGNCVDGLFYHMEKYCLPEKLDLRQQGKARNSDLELWPIRF